MERRGGKETGHEAVYVILGCDPCAEGFTTFTFPRTWRAIYFAMCSQETRCDGGESIMCDLSSFEPAERTICSNFYEHVEVTR